MAEIGVLGPEGNLGKYLVDYCGCDPINVDITDLGNDEKSMISAFLTYDVIINCAAYTKVDLAETPEGYKEAISVNTSGVGSLLFLRDKLPLHSSSVFHISTDYVFSGDYGPYSEEAIPVVPVNKYGWSKLGGETLFRTFSREGDMLIRTTGLYGGHKNDFYTMVVNNLKEGKQIEITRELEGNQTYIPHLAEALIDLCDCTRRPRILNIASSDVVPRSGFALMIAEANGLDKSLISSCYNDDVPGWVAKRPTTGGLKTKLAEYLDVPIYSIKMGLIERVNRED